VSLSDAEYARWLNSNGEDRVVLVELEHSSGVEYLASRPYISLPSDDDPHRSYDDALEDTLNISSSLDGVFRVGRISVLNGGEYDDWREKNWKGYKICTLLGAPSWSRDDFREIITAVNSGLSGWESGRVTFQTRDQKVLFEKPLQIMPITFGQPFNVRPILTSSATHEYQVNKGAVTSVAVRDNGLSVDFTLSNGKFTLSARPQGEVSADVVQVDKTAKTIINVVCAHYGQEADQAALNALPEHVLGLYYDSEVTGTRILGDVCQSLGAYWRIGPSGKVEVLQMTSPATKPDFSIDVDDIEMSGVRFLRSIEPHKILTLKYRHNFNLHNQGSVAGAVTDDMAEQLTTEWRRVTATNAVSEYPLAQNHEIETYLVEKQDAQTECDRIAEFHSVRRDVWQIRGFLSPAQAHPGQTVAISHPMLNRNALILSVDRSITRASVTLEVLV